MEDEGRVGREESGETLLERENETSVNASTSEFAKNFAFLKSRQSFAQASQFAADLKGHTQFEEEEGSGNVLESQGNQDGSGSVVDGNPSPSVAKVESVALEGAVAAAKRALVADPKQRANPAMRFIRNVITEFRVGFGADFLVGPHSCVLFLSLQYHLLHPEYIYSRVKSVASKYRLRIMLVLTDIPNPVNALNELSKLCLLAEYVMICSASFQEAARYLETYRALESKPPDSIMERVENDYLSRLSGVLKSVKGINKRDVQALAATFHSLDKILAATEDEFKEVPGLGPTKARRLRQAFNTPLQPLPKKTKTDQTTPNT
mmetsp:Transcript_3760/g.6575  ORF Transcript_3760/g.6575 Transcript_3760/m.6575 type:complete len:321 (-) Transcript_3760:431-1393(-)|eukprot:CAMPEP_0182445482 /NCGR_PEP_ID=MMETSP1172-20130603/3590_1 /TAXON_ID=708627 /ORGANISM="Timspurckia oligopyrenoides, Strain CCMP3278" /LENGTH=320 /DNA_ID=CAMNT_0024641265 /DNA_START=171 /DNA_END=1133 /DNA_ORIENTATION=-